MAPSPRTSARHVLLLAGTREARSLAKALSDAGLRATASMAGATQDPQTLAIPTRFGGFGGVDGLRAWCGSNGVTHILDATHPYARQMQASAWAVSRALDLAHCRVERPPWDLRPGWTAAQDLEIALLQLPPGARVLLTTGTRGLAALDQRRDVHPFVRTISPVEGLPAHAVPVIARPPFSPDAERALLQDHAITHLITKNAGGTGTAKLDAADDAGVGVVLIDRPPMAGGIAVPSAAAAWDWLITS